LLLRYRDCHGASASQWQPPEIWTVTVFGRADWPPCGAYAGW